MNEIEREVKQALNQAAKSSIMNPHLESRAWNQLSSNIKAKKPFSIKKSVTICLLLSLVLIVGTAYAESAISKIKLLTYIGHVPIFSKQSGTSNSLNLELEQEKKSASDKVFNENKVGREVVAGISPVPFILPTLPDGYELKDEFGIPGRISQQIREGKLENTFLQKDGTFSYIASFSKANNDPIVIQYSYYSKFQDIGSMELRFETDKVELEGYPVTQTETSSIVWIELKDGALLTINISGPQTYSIRERNDGLKEVLKKLNLK
ncbi:hypothetical protein GC102_15040 [Paenibacillus sp. LMG 31460]|uniref:DUF4367 domain-containing protein n=1 Tax=Paenibacillus germinis TaxID=2654979 RepID=A0ABX1Z1I8_9BACL|nr:hypothetical protein [Paenibacillus germinis]NOU87086.1 hypothetical protein [Paenibacillus germinis]